MAKTRAAKRPAKKAAKKPMMKTAKKVAKGKTKPKPRAKAKAKKAKPKGEKPGPGWFDTGSHKPLIGGYVQRLEPFIAALADGTIDDNELKAQENRLVASMKKVEPGLSAKQHAGVTELLCELTAYDVMQMLHAMQSSKPKATFQG